MIVKTGCFVKTVERFELSSTRFNTAETCREMPYGVVGAASCSAEELIYVSEDVMRAMLCD